MRVADPKQRGPAPAKAEPSSQELAEARQEIDRLRAQLPLIFLYSPFQMDAPVGRRTQSKPVDRVNSVLQIIDGGGHELVSDTSVSFCQV